MKNRKSVDLFIFLIVILLIFIIAARAPLDSDFWWHLRAGESTWLQKAPLMIDSFSFTETGSPWINHSWLSQVIFFLLFNFGHYYAICLLVSVIAVTSMGLVYIQMEGPPIYKAFLLIAGSIVASMVWSPRPQIFSLVMLALTGYILNDFKWQGKDRVWILIPIFIFWSNLHGGYPLGLLLIGCYISGEIINHILGYSGMEILSWRQIFKLGTLLILCGLVVLINPNGLNIWRVPFQTVGIGSLQQFISEWASPDFHDISQQPFLWLSLLFTVSVGLSKKRFDGTDLMSFVLFSWMGFTSRRNFGPFPVVILPALSRHLWAAILNWIQVNRKLIEKNEWLKILPSQNGELPIKIWQKFVNISVIFLLVMAAAAKVYSVSNLVSMSGYMGDQFPVDAKNWIITQKPEGNLFNEYEWGGYLDYSLRNYPVFIDGRTDLFGDKIIQEWLRVVQGEEGWQKIFNDWKVGIVLLKPERPINRLLSDAGWKEVYRDKQAIIFIR